MPRSYINTDLESLRLMWIPGWKVQTFLAWVRAFDFSLNWFKHRPWSVRTKEKWNGNENEAV